MITFTRRADRRPDSEAAELEPARGKLGSAPMDEELDRGTDDRWADRSWHRYRLLWTHWNQTWSDSCHGTGTRRVPGGPAPPRRRRRQPQSLISTHHHPGTCFVAACELTAVRRWWR